MDFTEFKNRYFTGNVKKAVLYVALFVLNFKTMRRAAESLWGLESKIINYKKMKLRHNVKLPLMFLYMFAAVFPIVNIMAAIKG